MSPLLTGLTLIVVSIVVGVLGYLLKKSIIESINELKGQIKILFESNNIFQREVIRDYVTKEEYINNNRSHKEIWIEIRELRDKTSKNETRAESGKEQLDKLESQIEKIKK